MSDVFVYGGLISGLSALAGVVLMYFKWKPKHPVDIKAQEVKIKAEKLDNEDHIIKRYQDEYNRLTERVDDLEKTAQDRKDLADNQTLMLSEQEAECDRKIAELNQIIHRLEISDKENREEIGRLKEELEIVKRRCKRNCFVAKNQSQ